MVNEFLFCFFNAEIASLFSAVSELYQTLVQFDVHSKEILVFVFITYGSLLLEVPSSIVRPHVENLYWYLTPVLHHYM